jgi:hypothetical protein
MNGKIMRMFYLLLILCLASCVQAGYESNNFFRNLFAEYENTVGKKTASQTVYEKILEKNHENSPEITVAYIPQNGIIGTCNITFASSDFFEVKQYYNKLYNFIKNNWNLVKPVSKYKQPNGELYSKNGIYLYHNRTKGFVCF